MAAMYFSTRGRFSSVFGQAVDQRAQLALGLGLLALQRQQIGLALALAGQVGGGLLGSVHGFGAGLQNAIDVDVHVHCSAPLSAGRRRMFLCSLYCAALRGATVQPKNSRSMEFSGTRLSSSASTSAKRPARLFSVSHKGCSGGRLPASEATKGASRHIS